MEILYAHALLCAAGLAPEEAYTSCLHAQFLARPDDHLLLSLECTTDPYAAAFSLQSYFTSLIRPPWTAAVSAKPS